jgi:hypothetical protein
MSSALGGDIGGKTTSGMSQRGDPGSCGLHISPILGVVLRSITSDDLGIHSEIRSYLIKDVDAGSLSRQLPHPHHARALVEL